MVVPPLTLIVAASRSNGIGQGSRLPWRLPLEMAYFARVTAAAPTNSSNVVIMGRNTWESIPPRFRPLKGRINLVLSRNPEYLKNNTGVTVHLSLQDALSQPTSSSQTMEGPEIHRYFIIGGASVYKEALELALPTNSVAAQPPKARVDRILLTRILSPTFEDCDVFFPEFRDVKGLDGESIWMQASHGELEAWVASEVPKGVQQEKGVEYEFQMWTRRV